MKKNLLLIKYNKLIYFCYRRNIFPIKNRFNVGVSRDSGWGCMIRCGQMIMSHAIYKYLKSKNVPPNLKDKYQQTCLYYTCREGKNLCSEFLVKECGLNCLLKSS